ncbi:MAG: futalosine hydrolase [Prevotellaceae bacterium]|jgi:futalosine hydrolase|nr:futalosine hydrolase [Prevotellaceae bacterium]
MNFLITAATREELAIAQELAPHRTPDVWTCAITGIGIAATVYHTLKLLQTGSYDAAINIGIAGSFTERLLVGSVCCVSKEYFGDCGIQTPQGFHTLFDEHLVDRNAFPFVDEALHAPTLRQPVFDADIPKAVGVTVHTVSGEQPRIAGLRARFSPDIETMESAAFFYVCLQEKIPFIALRAVSNKVAPRDRSTWDIPLALNNLAEALKTMK